LIEVKEERLMMLLAVSRASLVLIELADWAGTYGLDFGVMVVL